MWLLRASKAKGMTSIWAAGEREQEWGLIGERPEGKMEPRDISRFRPRLREGTTTGAGVVPTCPPKPSFPAASACVLDAALLVGETFCQGLG